MSENDYILGEEVHLRRKARGTAMIAVRLTSPMLSSLDEYARRHSITISEAVRMAIASLLQPSYSSSVGMARTHTIDARAHGTRYHDL